MGSEAEENARDHKLKHRRVGHRFRQAEVPIVGGVVTSAIHVLILVPIFFMMMKERELRRNSAQDN